MLERRSFLSWNLKAIASLCGLPFLKAGSATPTLPTSSTLVSAHARDATDFGAKGDGVSDDTRAIQTAFDNPSSSGDVFIPPKVYRVGPLMIRKPIRVEASGAVFLAIADAARETRMIDITADNVHIRGVALNGSEAACGYGIHGSGVSGLVLANLNGEAFGESFIRLSRCRNGSLRTIRATRCQLNEDTTRNGVIRIQASEGVRLEDIHIADGQGKGLAFGHSSDCIVENLHVHRQLAQGGTCLYFNNSHNIRVEGGVLYLSQENAIKISRGSTFVRLLDLDVLTDHSLSPRAQPPCLLIMGGSDCTICDCTFTARGEGSKQVVRIQDHWAGHSCFQNKLETCSIVADTRSAVFRGVEFLGSDDQRENQIIDCEIRAGYGVDVARGTGNRIIGCDIVATTYGVFARVRSRNTTVEHCKIESTTRASAQGVRAEGPGARLRDNIIRIAGMGHCILFSGKNAKGHVAIQNDCYGGGIKRVGGAAGRMSGNRVITAGSARN